jgi:surfeit locus 1 family protein
MTNYCFTPKPVPTFITIIMLALLLGLGFWQLQRAEWKRGIIEHYTAQSALEPLNALSLASEADKIIYRRAVLGGKFIHHQSIELRPRVQDGVVGYDLVAPLKLYTGEIIFVLRGFVPDSTKEFIDAPTGTVAVSGVLKSLPPQASHPDNAPSKNQWYWLDAAAVAQKYNLEKPYPLLLAAQDAPTNTTWPRPHNTVPVFNDFHLAYAATWFLLAFILLLFYLRAHIRKV